MNVASLSFCCGELSKEFCPLFTENLIPIRLINSYFIKDVRMNCLILITLTLLIHTAYVFKHAYYLILYLRIKMYLEYQ
jgi:hypothetical protein